MGHETLKRVPFPSSLSKLTEPPSLTTISRTMLRPKPVPPFCRESEASAWANLPKIRSRKASGIPAPRSITLMRRRRSSADTRTVTFPPRGENLVALERRFETTCINRSSSANTTANGSSPISGRPLRMACPSPRISI